MNKNEFSGYIKSFNFKQLFIELGWNNFTNKIPIVVDEKSFELEGIVEKKGFIIVHCLPMDNENIPDSQLRKKIEIRLRKYKFEHLIIYIDKAKTKQVWQYVIRETDRPNRVREIPYNIDQDPESLWQRARGLLFTLDEEGNITLPDVITKFKGSFGKNTEKVTNKFYTGFKKHHTVFLDSVKGIEDTLKDIDNKNKQWYVSLMLNRLMFCYFIQKRGYLDNDTKYLTNKLTDVKQKAGKDQFYTFYREFLLQLFHQGLGQPPESRKLTVDLGKIPYLNGGLFDIHELEKKFTDINIKDEAFEKIFEFFDEWYWHLDTRVEASGKDINPDVIGYIFEKYINDRASMGAYYTREDITDYIAKNTIIPFLFDKVKNEYPHIFKPDSFIWTYLRESGDTYIYEAVKKGIDEATVGSETAAKIEDLDIPENIAIGLNTSVPDLLECRKDWNTRTPGKFALPTEIWRETIDRWKRYFDIKKKIETAEITSINDFITYNLNIRQFIQDILENTDNPDLIRYFFKAIRSVTVLDPTCGSGAFLFAALNILEPLYETCIERMEQFTSEEPRKYKYFHEVLAEVNCDEHPNLQYYIYKSIILNNLFGVDIMNEAVEIAKLRLFLKMVGAVEMEAHKPNFGLEPLPDIDFNIRAGNTLVGFATEDELFYAISDRKGLYAKETIDAFREECEIVATAYKRFQNSQLLTDAGEDSHRESKVELQNRLAELNDKLNEYLASTYHIYKEKHEKKYQEWLACHQPFHWFAEFYEIIHGRGGFDVIIGNPPYVEYKDVFRNYTLLNFQTIACKNLFAFTYERAIGLCKKNGIIGLIIPVASVCTDRYSPLQELWLKSGGQIISNFNDRPGKLFEGLEHIRLSIVLLKKSYDAQLSVFTTKYNKWSTVERNFLFEMLEYINVKNSTRGGSIPKIGTDEALSILYKLTKSNLTVEQKTSSFGNSNIYYTRKLSGFVQILDFVPLIYDENKKIRTPSELKEIVFPENAVSEAVLAALNSSLFYWFLTVWSDCRNLNKREVYGFPIISESLSDRDLNKYGKLLMVDLKNKSRMLPMSLKGIGTLYIQCIYPKFSKYYIDEIDKLLAEHYGFTEEELDYIINYDIKYRMGKVLFGEEEDTGDEDE